MRRAGISTALLTVLAAGASWAGEPDSAPSTAEVQPAPARLPTTPEVQPEPAAIPPNAGVQLAPATAAEVQTAPAALPTTAEVQTAPAALPTTAEVQLAPAGVPTISALTPPVAAPRGFLTYPEGPGRFQFRLGVGALMDVLSLKEVQSEARQVPQVLAQLRYGLPWGFSADARLTAIVVKNELELGIAWSARLRKLWFSAFDHHGFSYGAVGVQGFDATSWGWLNKPGLALGLPIESTRFTLSYELIFTLTQHTRLGDLTTVRRLAAGYVGDALLLTVETLLHNGGIIFYGLGLLRTAPNYELWLAFSDQRAQIAHPRFFAGYAF